MCSVLKEIELLARKMLRWKAMRARVRRYDVAQQAFTARLQKSVEYYKELRDRCLERKKSRSSGSRKKGGSQKMREPECKYKTEE